MTRRIQVGGRSIGADQPPYVIAEAGVNHNGNTETALRLVDVAADAGADAIKFQSFDADSLATADTPQAAYQRERDPAGSQVEMLRHLQLPDDAWRALAVHAADRGIAFLSTPFDPRNVALLDALDVPAFKVGSGDVTNLPLLRAVGGTGRPVILSTGMATLTEVEEAVATLRAAGAREVAVLHCTSAYPADAADLNLRAIDTLRDRLGVVVGYSDHSLGLTAAIAAVARGAAIVEKHVTLDRGQPGPDHAASLEPKELADMVRATHDAWLALGDGAKAPRPAEADTIRVARRSLVTRRALAAGAVLAREDLDAKRPGTGISPMRLDEVVGRRVRVDLPADHVIGAAELDPPLDPPLSPSGS